MNMNSPSIAVLGCGYWGQNLVRNFYQLGVLRLVADIAESGRAKARELAPKVEVIGDFETVFQRDDIKAVALATPAETHEQLTLRAFESGKDVFVEKPMALDYRQGLRMQTSAHQNNRILMVGHLLEYHPAVLKLRELLAAGELGRVNYIYSNRLNFGKIRTEENALWSFAPHDIAVILRLIGELPVEVTCVGGSYVTPHLADVTVSCLRFGSGVRAHIFVSWLNPFKEQKLVVVGDRQMAVFNDLSQEAKLVLYDQRVEVNHRQPLLQKGESRTASLPNQEPLRNECEHFLECILTRHAPLTDSTNGIQVLKVLQACQRSLQNHGVPVLLDDI